MRPQYEQTDTHRSISLHSPSNPIQSIYLRSRIQEPLKRLVIKRSKQLITQIRTRTPQQAFKVLKRRVEIQPVGRLLREAKSSRRHRRSISAFAARWMLTGVRRWTGVEEVGNGRGRLVLLETRVDLGIEVLRPLLSRVGYWGEPAMCAFGRRWFSLWFV